MKLWGAPRAKYIGKPTHNLNGPSLEIDFTRQSPIPLYIYLFFSCFCNFTLILSAGKVIIAVNSDDAKATKLLWLF